MLASHPHETIHIVFSLWDITLQPPASNLFFGGKLASAKLAASNMFHKQYIMYMYEHRYRFFSSYRFLEWELHIANGGSWHTKRIGAGLLYSPNWSQHILSSRDKDKHTTKAEKKLWLVCHVKSSISGKVLQRVSLKFGKCVWVWVVSCRVYSIEKLFRSWWILSQLWAMIPTHLRWVFLASNYSFLIVFQLSYQSYHLHDKEGKCGNTC